VPVRESDSNAPQSVVTVGGADSRTARTASRVGALAIALMLAGCTAAVLFFGTWRVQCPGLYYDEVLYVEGWQPQRHFAWYVGDVPVMSLSYLGALKSWLYWPLRDRLSVEWVRAPWILSAVVCLLLTYLVCRRLAGRTAGMWAALLLAVDPAFLFLHRLDWGPVAIAMLLRMASLALVLRWRAVGGDARLVVAALLIGIGLYDKVIFAWYVAALVVAALATWPSWGGARLRVVVASLVALALGALPLLAYNVRFPLATFGNNTILTTEPLLRQLGTRLTLMAETLSGAGVYHFVNGQPLAAPLPCPGLPPWLAGVVCRSFPLPGAWLPPATLLALLAVAGIAPLRNAFAPRFLAVLTVGIGVIMLPVAQATGAHHVAMLLPFPQMLLAVVVVEAWRKRSRWRLPLVAALFAVLATGFAVSARTLVSFGGLCGRGVWSPATYALAGFAANHPDDRIMLADWGFASQLHTLAPGATLDDWSWALRDDRATPADLAPVSNRRTFLILHTHATTVFSTVRHRALAHVRAAGLHARQVEVARDLDGRATAFVLELVPRRRGDR
jgi:hypothetical protein